MNVLLIGLGSIAKKHIQALQQLVPDIQIQALRSDPRSIGAPMHGVKNVFSIASATKPDFVIVSNPTAFHRETIESVLSLNCPLFIEKPIFHKAGLEEETLVRKLAASKLPTYVACNLRFHPAIKFMKVFLETQTPKVDEVNVYCGSYLPLWRPGTDFRVSYSTDVEKGGGVHLDLIHELDYLYFLFGEPDIIKSLKMNKSSLNINSIDSARYLLGYKDFSVSLSLNYFRKEARRTIELITEKNILLIDLIKSTVTDTLTGAVLFHTPEYKVADTYLEQMDYFLKNNSKSLMNDADEAYQILKLALS
jgi:predicted dehydrogenase